MTAIVDGPERHDVEAFRQHPPHHLVRTEREEARHRMLLVPQGTFLVRPSPGPHVEQPARDQDLADRLQDPRQIRGRHVQEAVQGIDRVERGRRHPEAEEIGDPRVALDVTLPPAARSRQMGAKKAVSAGCHWLYSPLTTRNNGSTSIAEPDAARPAYEGSYAWPGLWEWARYSWATDATRTPSRRKNCPAVRPRTGPDAGAIFAYSSQSDKSG